VEELNKKEGRFHAPLEELVLLLPSEIRRETNAVKHQNTQHQIAVLSGTGSMTRA